jgi:hypothetical protein
MKGCPFKTVEDMKKQERLANPSRLKERKGHGLSEWDLEPEQGRNRDFARSTDFGLLVL